MTYWAQAFREHRLLLLVVAAYCAATVAEALYFSVPFSNLLDIFRYIVLSFLMPLLFLAGVYAGAFFGYLAAAPEDGVKKAIERLDAAAGNYATGQRFAYACAGFLALQAGNFFLIAKSLIDAANPFSKMKWDLDFAAWDKALHFGVYPHKFIIPFVNSLHMGKTLDRAYVFWFAVMTVVGGYNLFGDRQVHRRLRYLWGYVLSWVLLGSVMATCFSSVGPLFFNGFFPEEGGPYDMIVLNLREMQQQSATFADMARRLLMRWARSDTLFNPNAISAMPSMHIAIAWLVALYAREFNRWLFAAALVFCVTIFLGAVYFGFHYAIDAYVSVAGVSLIWWVTGKCLDRRMARDAKLQEAA